MARHRRIKQIDYAIIGGGIAGVYCAWRLKEKHKEKKIILFEYSDRIGGRLLTLHDPNHERKMELGGMRYMPESHPIFHRLVYRLGLTPEPFPMGYDNPADSKRHDPTGGINFGYFHGRHLKISDFDKSSKVPFNVHWSEQDKSPDALQLEILKKLVPGGGRFDNANDWFNVQVFGEYLWKYGFWNLLYRVLSPEAYQFFKYGSGYDTNASNGNAVALLPTGDDYSPGNQFLTVKEGMMSVPKTLCEEFEGMGGKVELNRRLISINRIRKTGNYELHFAITKTDEKRQENTIDTGKGDEFWEATNVILALPKASLERIQWKYLKKDPVLKKDLDSVLIQPAVKIFLEYEYAWWKALGLFRGRSITDLPIRQTYYMSDLSDLELRDPFKITSKHAILMASYSDIESVPFWEGLEGDGSKGNQFPGPIEGYRASRIMVNEAHKQVMEIHGQYELPKPCAAAYRNWSEMSSGGAWHCWKAGFRYSEIIDRMRHPIATEKVYICGEAYSPYQGWAEGSLQTAEELLCTDLDTKDRLDPVKERLDWVRSIKEEEEVKPLVTMTRSVLGRSMTPEGLIEIPQKPRMRARGVAKLRLSEMAPEDAAKWTRRDSKGRLLRAA